MAWLSRQRRRALSVCLIFPAAIYLLHFRLFLLIAGSNEQYQPQDIILRHPERPVSKPERQLTVSKAAVLMVKAVREGSGPNITNILIAKKMGGLLHEMDRYRFLMKDALTKGANVSKVGRVENGLEVESMRRTRQQYEKTNITNYFYLLNKEVVNPYNFKYIINNEGLCSKDTYPLTYLLYVHSAQGNQQLRSNIRRTWGQPNLFPQFPSRTVFFVGRVVEKWGSKQRALEEEARQYGDIVQLDFIDSYHNLTYKGMGAMRWVSEFCPNTRYVFKSDDDVYVNMPVLLHRLTHEFFNKTRFLMGHLFKFPSLHIQRPGKLCSKWCIPFDVLPGLDHFPTFSSGSFYLYTQDMAEELYTMATRTPFFWVDDVYLTGIVAARVEGLQHIDIAKAYRFNLSVYKKSLTGLKPLTVTLTKDQVGMWKYHLPLMNGTWLNILGQERHSQLLKEAATSWWHLTL